MAVLWQSYGSPMGRVWDTPMLPFTECVPDPEDRGPVL